MEMTRSLAALFRAPQTGALARFPAHFQAFFTTQPLNPLVIDPPTAPAQAPGCHPVPGPRSLPADLPQFLAQLQFFGVWRHQVALRAPRLSHYLAGLALAWFPPG